MRFSDLYPERYPTADGYVASQPPPMPPKPNTCIMLAIWRAPTAPAIITNTDEACAIVRNLVALVEGQQVDFVAALFRSIWGAEPGRLAYLNRPSFYGEILCCWRPRWIPGSRRKPDACLHAWYIWRKTPRSGPSLKVRLGSG